MANIDDAFTIDKLSLDDNVLMVAGSIDPTISTGYEAPIGSLYVRTNGELYQKTNTADVDWTSVGNSDVLVKVSSDDTTAGYLNGKVVAGNGMALVENNGGGNETLTIDTLAMLWNDIWVDGNTYTQNDVVRDGTWTMVANTTTSDRPAPQEDGDSIHGLPSIPAWSNNSNTSVVVSGHTYTFTKFGWITAIRVWVTELTATTNYRFILRDITNPSTPIIKVINDPLLNLNGWTDIAIGVEMIAPGTIWQMEIDALDSGTSTNVTGGWTTESKDNNNAPSAQSWNRNNGNTLIRIDKTDLNSTSRTAELLGVTIDSEFLIAETAIPANFYKYSVLEAPTDEGTYIEYVVQLVESGNNGATDGEISTIDIDVPIPQTTEYVQEVDYWASNTLPFATIVGHLEYDGVAQAGAENDSFGIDIEFQPGSVSNDWDLMAYSGEGNGSAAGGTNTDESVKVSPNDTTIGYLNGKLVSGASINFVENNDGGNETLSIDTTIPLADIQTEIDAIETASGGIFDTDGTFDATTVDTALVTVNTPTDLLDTLSQMDDAILATSEMASVVLGISGTITLPSSFADIDWDVTNLENDTATIEHNVSNIERIDIKETGLYLLTYAMSVDDGDPGEDAVSIQILTNGLTVIDGSRRDVTFKDSMHDISNTLTAELTAGDYITVQHEGAGIKTLEVTSNFTAIRLKGLRGAIGTSGSDGSDGTDGIDGLPGLPGGGTNITIASDGVAIPNTPHSQLNFIGDFGVTDAGGGTADLTLNLPVFGTEYDRAESVGLTTTTSTTFINKTSLTVNNLVGGDYRIAVSYGWNHNDGGSDFEGRIQENAVDVVEIHKQEPKDTDGNFGNSGTSQRYYVSRTIHRTLSPATSYTYTLDFRTDKNGSASGIWEAVIEFWRVT